MYSLPSALKTLYQHRVKNVEEEAENIEIEIRGDFKRYKPKVYFEFISLQIVDEILSETKMVQQNIK